MVLDTSPDARRITAQVTQLLDEALPRDPRVAEHRGFIERQLREALRQARAQQLDFCALLATVIDDVLPMLATFTIAQRTIGHGSSLVALLEDLQRQPHVEVSVVSVAGVGDVVRAQFRKTLNDSQFTGARPPSGAPARVEAAVWQYFVPTPRRRHLAIVTAATPLLQLVDSFSDLFDAVMHTFRFSDESAAPE
jgi:hypothetical protein